MIKYTTLDRQQYLLDWIQDNNYTYTQAANELGISVNSVRRYFVTTHNGRKPSWEVIRRIDELKGIFNNGN
jgi:response regulator of citrate/malate metabolism